MSRLDLFCHDDACCYQAEPVFGTHALPDGVQRRRRARYATLKSCRCCSIFTNASPERSTPTPPPSCKSSCVPTLRGWWLARFVQRLRRVLGLLCA